MRRAWSAMVTVAGVTLATVVPAITPASAAVSASAQVRVNQVGYPTDAPKVAYAMLPAKVASVRFEVITPYGVAYRAVYRLSFSGVNTPGRYQVKVLSPGVAVSPMFIIGDGAQLYRQLVDNAVQYFKIGRAHV